MRAPSVAAAAATALERDLELDQHHIRCRQPIDRFEHLLARELAVRALRHDDRVDALRVDGDVRDAGRHVHAPAHGGDVDALARERVRQPGAFRVVADAGDHRHVDAVPCGGDGLVGAFSAQRLRVAVGEQGLARAGQPRDARDEVQVEASDDCQPCGRLRHVRMIP